MMLEGKAKGKTGKAKKERLLAPLSARKTSPAKAAVKKPAAKRPLLATPASRGTMERPGLYVRMGQLVGQSIRSETDVLGIVRKGLPASAVYGFAREFTMDPDLVAPQSTLRRRVDRNQVLTVDESERMMRIARITSMAEDLYCNEVQAKRWLSKPGTFVPGDAPISPLALAATEAGARIVENAILRAAHGML